VDVVGLLLETRPVGGISLSRAAAVKDSSLHKNIGFKEESDLGATLSWCCRGPHCGEKLLQMLLLRGSAISSWPASANLRCVVAFLLGCLFSWTPLAVLSQSCDGAPNADTCPCVVFIPPAGASQPTVTGGPECESNGASGQLYFTCYDWDRLQTLLATHSASCDQIATVRFSGTTTSSPWSSTPRPQVQALSPSLVLALVWWPLLAPFQLHPA
jgi:hypothetical protein